MTKRKRKTRKKTKKSFFSLKILFTILLILLFSLLGFGYYLYDKGYLILDFNKSIKQELKEKKEIKKVKDVELISKMKKMLKQKKEKIQKDLDNLDKQRIKDKNTSKKEVPKLEKISAKNEANKTIKTLTNPKKTSLKDANKSAKKEAKIFPSIEDALNSQVATEVEDYVQSTKKKKPEKPKPRVKRAYKGKPKLAIIIDDVSFEFQTKKIKKIPYKVTPSFLPPSKIHPDTPKIAKSFPIYMVHVPMEAIKHAHPEIRTLKKGESYKSIKSTITKIKSQFPRAKYYNNHTGSKFTADKISMQRLLRVLKEENILFIDSKTTADSKAEEVAKNYNMEILARDTFLDNSYKPRAIKKQLKEAVEVAKRHGYAIAICHPHKSTLNVLRYAKPLLKDVDLVYVNELK